MEINIINTPKKYEDKAEEVVSTLFKLLNEILPIQERAVLRFQRMEQKQLTIAEKSENTSDIMKKCKAEYTEVIEGKCTEKEMSLVHPSHIGTTAEYAYIKGEYTVDFTMKKADTAVVITHYKERTSEKKHKFVLKLARGKWLADEVYSGYEDQRRWYYIEI